MESFIQQTLNLIQPIFYTSFNNKMLYNEGEKRCFQKYGCFSRAITRQPLAYAMVHVNITKTNLPPIVCHPPPPTPAHTKTYLTPIVIQLV